MELIALVSASEHKEMVFAYGTSCTIDSSLVQWGNLFPFFLLERVPFNIVKSSFFKIETSNAIDMASIGIMYHKEVLSTNIHLHCFLNFTSS